MGKMKIRTQKLVGYPVLGPRVLMGKCLETCRIDHESHGMAFRKSKSIGLSKCWLYTCQTRIVLHKKCNPTWLYSHYIPIGLATLITYIVLI